MKIKGEKEIIVETKRRGDTPIQIRAVETTAALFMDWVHNLILEARSEGKIVEVKSS